MLTLLHCKDSDKFEISCKTLVPNCEEMCCWQAAFLDRSILFVPWNQSGSQLRWLTNVRVKNWITVTLCLNRAKTRWKLTSAPILDKHCRSLLLLHIYLSLSDVFTILIQRSYNLTKWEPFRFSNFCLSFFEIPISINSIYNITYMSHRTNNRMWLEIKHYYISRSSSKS